MIDETPYPVITQTSLDPLQRRFLPGRWSDIDGLAWQHPGSVLVFQIRDQFVAAPPGRRVASRFATATAVALVSLQPRTVTVSLMLQSCWSQFYVKLDVEYDCQVTDAELVLQFGCWDVRPHLQRYFAADPLVRVGAVSADPFDFKSFRLWLISYAIARNSISPPYIPGMVCGLTKPSVDFVHWPFGPGGEGDPAIENPPNVNGANGHKRAPQDYIWDEE